ncbi:hypothetical protein SEA_BAXTERFOX_32 [Gordonia phage BaxterFox]|uniref:Membrane protein n=2 Tax=Baxterfoxvirus TaxID=3044672 RepID=A0A7G8LG90_9CAUD|nr:hypothetical protein SEA_BAXTERFOX_32 [Gordonia phage BaxterFox]YP_010653308.1 membrane protein [Gordonia phage Ohgeesy]AMS03842.1 hypothetical protein SEA_BAXTERFOX_32 [Gordonia phage BaxterFox]QNJ56262.1 membrane protein [Gordonia phage Ohgeesy]
MTTTVKRPHRRRVDAVSLALMVVGLLFGAISYCLVTFADVNALIMVPSIVAATVGASHLVKREAPRE